MLKINMNNVRKNLVKNMKKKFLLSAIFLFLLCFGFDLGCFAIEDADVNLTPKQLKELKKLEKRAKKESNHTYTEEINKNILTPNISPGFLNDTEKTRQYYNQFESAHRTQLQEALEEPIVEDEKLKLPARIQNDAIEIWVEKVIFSDSEIFSELELYNLKNIAERQLLTAEDINNYVALINAQYAKKNIFTARAILESFENGILKIELMEARIGKVYVEGNKFNRKWFLKKQISSKPSDILNLQLLENDLKNFNKDARSIKLSAKLRPGEEYGTTDVILKAEESFPYHFSASWDSFGRETTGLLRGGLMLSTDSLFGFQDRLTGAINMAHSSFTPFVDYNVPINRKGTRLGGSYMYGKSKVMGGDYKDFDLNANTHVFSTYLSHPLIDTQKTQLKINTSANIKLSTADISGFQYTNYKDYNLAFGLGGRFNFNKSVLFGSVYSTNGIIRDDIRSFSQYFTKINADGYYIHYLPKGIIATVRAGGQYSPQDIPFIEQFQIGGISSVRGYSESLLLGGNSYFVSMEMLFPIPFLPEEIKIPFNKKDGIFRLKDSIKLALFMDNGAIIPNHGKTGTTNFLSSVGAGIRLAISKFLTARIYIGVPLMNAGVYNQAGARAHFDLIASPF